MLHHFTSPRISKNYWSFPVDLLQVGSFDLLQVQGIGNTATTTKNHSHLGNKISSSSGYVNKAKDKGYEKQIIHIKGNSHEQ